MSDLRTRLADRHDLGREAYGDPLAGVERAMTELDDPHRAFETVLVTGTNGAGTVSNAVGAMLRRAGYRVGVRSSLADGAGLRSKFEVNGTLPDAATLESLVDDVATRVSTRDEWDVLVVAGAEHFAREGVDVAVVEVGVGGRDDSTNVHPTTVGVVTNAAPTPEHPHLGDTAREVARRKAGILDPESVGVVNGSPAVREAVLGVAGEVGARGVAVDDPVTFALPDGDRTYEAVYRGERVDTRLAAPYERENLQTAVTAAEAGPYDVPAAAVRETLATYKGAGRCEFVGASPEVLLDGAHNPDGAAALAAVLDRAEDVTLVFGGSEDGWHPTLDRLLPVVDRVVATCGPNYDEPTAAEVGAAVDAAAVVPDPVDAVDRAAALGGPDTLVAVTGSLYVLDPVRAALTE